jgi:HEAT repeat protein
MVRIRRGGTAIASFGALLWCCACFAPPPSGPTKPVKVEAGSDKEVWVDAPAQAARVDDVRVQVTRAIYDHVPIRDLGPAKSTEKQLIIHLKIENLSEATKYSYHLWGRGRLFDTHNATLTDEFGNRYLPIDFGLFASIDGQQRAAVSLYPGKPLTDVLVFEEPVKKAKTLKLELPGSALDKNATFRFRIAVATVEGFKGSEEAKQPSTKDQAIVDPPPKTDPDAEEAAKKRQAEDQRTARIKQILDDVKSTDPKVRRTAMAALSEAGERAKEAIPELSEAILDNDKALRLTALTALRKLGPQSKPAVPNLIKAMGMDSGTRREAILVVTNIGPEAEAAAQTLVAILADKDHWPAASKALAKIGKGAVPALVKGLKSTSQPTRQFSARTLGEIGADAIDALPALRERAKADTSVSVREDAQKAINQIIQE